MDAQQDLLKAAEDFRQHVAANGDDDEGPAGEYKAAEYIIFTLALDVYIRHLEETIEFYLARKQEKLNLAMEGRLDEDPHDLEAEISKLEQHAENPTDKVVKAGVQLLKRLDRDLETFQRFMSENLPGKPQQAMLSRTLRKPARSSEGAGLRAQGLKGLLSIGGSKTIRGIFDTQKLRKQINDAIVASKVADGDAALDKFAAMPVRNALIRKWLDWAAKVAKPLMAEGITPDKLINPIQEASVEAAEPAAEVMVQQAQQMGTTGADEAQEAQEVQQAALTTVEQAATQKAREALEKSGEPDEPPARSEVVGIATAAAVAAMSDVSNPRNVPEPLKKLDDEQLAAALTDGKVLIAAGAGAGKSTTLIARCDYLVRDREVDPERMLVTSFNTKAADELREKLDDKLGSGSPKHVGTMHSMFGSFVSRYGTDRERSAMGDFKKVEGETSRAVQGIWKDCFPDEAAPSAKVMKLAKTQWAGNNVSPRDAMASAETEEERQAAKWYEMYEGLKGSLDQDLGDKQVIPWEPSCEAKAQTAVDAVNTEKTDRWVSMGSKPRFEPKTVKTTFEAYKAKNRPGDKRIADFDDMLKMCHDVMERDKGARKAIQDRFDHIMVDECVHESTLVTTPDGSVQVKELTQGTPVKTFENGKVTFKPVIGISSSTKTQGVTLRLASGRELSTTFKHRLYATSYGEVSEGCLALYLMHRRGKGFRIGVSSRPTARHGSNGARANAERADALWILEVGEASDMLFKEQAFSLRHGIPTYIFEGEVRGCDQERIDRIFDEFGENGRQLLEGYNLDFLYPHWTNKTYTGADHQRQVLTVRAHRAGLNASGTSVTTSWTGESSLDNYNHVYKVRGGRKMLNKRLANYVEVRDYALKLANTEGLRVVENLLVGEDTCTLITAGALLEGMSVPVLSESGELALDEIVEILPAEGTFIDIAVQDTANFFGNGVLSHNCQDLNEIQHGIIRMMSEHITDGEDGKSLWMVGDDKQSIYAFRGARPDLFIELDGKEGWKTCTIRTNYRCAPEIVDAANKLIAHNEDQIPMEANANPAKPTGVASIKVSTPPTDAAAAISTIEEIKLRAQDLTDAELGDFLKQNAVLLRTNKEIHAYETACIIRGIPYARKGSGSFLGSRETGAMLGYMDLIMGGAEDPKDMQKALAKCINEPNRFYTGSQTEAKTEEAIRAYAQKTETYIKDVDPSKLMGDPTFQQVLAETFGGKSEWRARKAMEKIRSMAGTIQDIQTIVDEPDFTTKDLFDEILGGFEGETDGTDDDGVPVKVTQSLRAALEVNIRDYSAAGDSADDDGDEEDDAAKLGNIGFLYMLMQADPTDPEDTVQSPQTPKGFKSKMGRLARRSDDLRYNLDWNPKTGDPEDKMSKLSKKDRKKPPAVFLGTVHSVKGAEWPTTYVQMPAGIFPYEPPPPKEGDPPLTEAELEKRAAELETERRLAYVAITRAEEKLTILCPKKVGGRDTGGSQFVGEAGLSVGENVPETGLLVEPGVDAETKVATDHYIGQYAPPEDPTPWDPTDFEGGQ